MAVVYSKVLLFDPPLIYTAPDICVFGAVRDAQSPFNNTLMSKDHGPNFVLEVLFKQVLSKCSHEMSYEGSSFGAINALLTLTCF